MEAKKRLARTIVAGFHGAEAAQQADANWARQFQQKSDDIEGLEEVRIPYSEIAGSADSGHSIRVPKLLVRAGLAASGAEANRKLAENAVRIDGETVTAPAINLAGLPARLTVRVGKRARVSVIE
jgi:tyrosyl-tRNA synthetase